MTQTVVKTDVYTDFHGLSALRVRAKNDSGETLREVAGQFEALFIQMMLKSMRDASLGEGLLDSEHTKTYQAMFDKQIAMDLSKSSGIGLADMLVRQLAGGMVREDGSVIEKVEQPIETEGLSEMERIRPERTFQQAMDADLDWRPESPEQFIRDLWPHAKIVAEQIGVQPEALISQAALETGWGKHMIRKPNGDNSFNLFGIKADSRWRGQRVVTETVEFRDGVMRKEKDSFRGYSDLAESFSDYAKFLNGNPRYRTALENAHNAPEFTRALGEAGYATDPGYAEKINRIMNSDRLSKTVSEIKSLGQKSLIKS